MINQSGMQATTVTTRYPLNEIRSHLSFKGKLHFKSLKHAPLDYPLILFFFSFLSLGVDEIDQTSLLAALPCNMKGLIGDRKNQGGTIRTWQSMWI